MWSGGMIEEVNTRIALEAAEEDQRPMTMTEQELIRRPFPIPVIGYMDASDNFQEIAEFFVDASGFGEEDEPALTHDQFENKARKLIESRSPVSVYWAVTEVGQFQVYVTAYVKEVRGDKEEV